MNHELQTIEQQISLTSAISHKQSVTWCIHSNILSSDINVESKQVWKNGSKLPELEIQTTVISAPALLPHLPHNTGMASWGVHYDC